MTDAHTYRRLADLLTELRGPAVADPAVHRRLADVLDEVRGQVSSDADCYRRLADLTEELCAWRLVVHLLPWTVHHDHRAERALARIPVQRGSSTIRA